MTAFLGLFRRSLALYLSLSCHFGCSELLFRRGLGRCMPGSMSEAPGEDGERVQRDGGVAGYKWGRPRDCALLQQGDTEEQVDGRRQPSSPISQSGNAPSKRAMKRALRRQRHEAAFEGKRRKKDDVNKEEKYKKEPNFTEDYLKETEYYQENGLRKVYPYYFTFSTHTKGRWVGKTLLSVFLEEFQADTEENYRKAIDVGKVTVNGGKVSADYTLKDNDFITNKVHRHEIPIVAAPIQIVENTDDVLVVNKPSSIPVHPCGRYRHNSLTYILAKEYDHRNLRTIHRIDRLTSGLMIFGKTEKKTREMMDHVKNRLVEKEYLCRVVGEFPSEAIECDEPINVLSHKLGLFKCCDEGKDACTTFQRISYNGRTSVVKCRPYTGRTHQIRVHLQFLGYPIVNDPIYNSDVWGPNRGKDGIFGKSEEQLIEDLTALHSRERHEVTGSEEVYATTTGESSSSSVSSSGKDSDISSETSGGISIEDTGQEEQEDSVSVEDKPTNSVNLSSASTPLAKGNKDFDETQTKENSAEREREIGSSEGVKEENGAVSDRESRTGSAGDSNAGSGSPPSSDSLASNGDSPVDCKDSKPSSSDSASPSADAKATSGVSETHSSDSKESGGDSKSAGGESSSVGNHDTTAPSGNVAPAMPQMPGPIAMMKMQFDMVISASFPGDGNAVNPAAAMMGMPGIPGLPPDALQKESNDLLPPAFDPSKLSVDADCVECKRRYRDPRPKELTMYLHAYRYKGPNWDFCTDVPEWAMADWQEPES